MRASSTLVFAALALLAPAVAAAALIQGKSEPERIAGTAKADRIDVVFGGRDRVKCGKGLDVVTADGADTIASDCEYVSRRISADTLTAVGAQHQTEVEPAAVAWRSTVVAAFQVGRFTNGGAAGIGWARSTDSGRTWRSGILPRLTTATNPPGDAPRASDPVPAYDAAHDTWLIATLVLGNNYTELGISRSADGASWSAPVSAARGPTTSTIAYDKEWIACDNTTASRFYGTCYLAYTDISGRRVALQVSRDGGATWRAPVTVTAQFGEEVEGALPLIQPDGALTIVFVNGDETGVFSVRSVDGGATFATPVGIAPVRQTSQPLLRAPSLPTAAVDASGRLYVAWADCRFRQGCNGNTIVLSSSTNGTTWTTPTRIPGSGFDSFVPGLAAHATVAGRIALVTYVRTGVACTLATCSVGVAVTSSRDGGATWSRPRRLDTVPPRVAWLANAGRQFVGDYVGAAYAGDRFVPVFALASKPLPGRLREHMMAASLP